MRTCALTLTAITIWLYVGALAQDPNCPKNVILVIGDGMGVAQEQAAQFYLGRPLSWQDAPYKATINTQSTSAVTDSAASGTAMSTGVLVDNDVVSVFIPGNGTDIRTSLEFYKNVQNKRVGMVTSTYIVHATPATFGAHEASRNNFQQIYNDYLVSKPHLIMGGGRPEVNLAAATTAGYRTATTKTQMNAFLPTDPLVMAVFGSDNMPYEFDQSANYAANDWPHLHEMVDKALDLLSSNNPNGFFLMIECGRIDHAGHENNIMRNIFETKECDLMFNSVKAFTQANPDTLTVVTADHECGGLTVSDNGAGNTPGFTWGTGGHTGTDINLYAYGSWASWVDGQNLDNELVFSITYLTQCSASQSSSISPSNSQSQSASRSVSPSVSPSKSESASSSKSNSASVSSSSSQSASGSRSPSPSRSSSASQSASPSRSQSQSATASKSNTKTATGTASRSGTASKTNTNPASGTASRSGTASKTNTNPASGTASRSGTASKTSTNLISSSPSKSGTASKTNTNQASGTPSKTGTNSASQSRQVSSSSSNSVKASATQTTSKTPSATSTKITAPSGSASPTRSPASSQSQTVKNSQSASKSKSSTHTPDTSVNSSKSSTPTHSTTPLPSKSHIESTEVSKTRSVSTSSRRSKLRDSSDSTGSSDSSDTTNSSDTTGSSDSSDSSVFSSQFSTLTDSAVQHAVFTLPLIFLVLLVLL